MDSIVISLCKCLTFFFAGFVVFAYIGNLAFETNQDIHNVIQEGN